MCRELLSLRWFIEHMKTTAVKHELKRAAGRWRGEKVRYSEAAAQSASLYFGLCSLNRERSDINPEYIEVAFRHPNCIRTSTTADFERPAWRDRV
jgi:hypothetical protein